MEGRSKYTLEAMAKFMDVSVTLIHQWIKKDDAPILCGQQMMGHIAGKLGVDGGKARGFSGSYMIQLITNRMDQVSAGISPEEREITALEQKLGDLKRMAMHQAPSKDIETGMKDLEMSIALARDRAFNANIEVAA